MSKKKKPVLGLLERIVGEQFTDRAGVNRLCNSVVRFSGDEKAEPLPLGPHVCTTPHSGGHYLLEFIRDGVVVARHWAGVGISTRDCIAGWLEMESASHPEPPDQSVPVPPTVDARLPPVKQHIRRTVATGAEAPRSIWLD